MEEGADRSFGAPEGAQFEGKHVSPDSYQLHQGSA